MSKSGFGPSTYFLVYTALIVSTLATVGLSYVELGAWHSILGLGIAVEKALLVILFFMHVLRSRGTIWIVALSSLLWLGLLMGGTLTEYLSRYWSL